MRLLEQLQIDFEFRSALPERRAAVAGVADPGTAVGDRGYNPPAETATGAVALQFQPGRDAALERHARELLRATGAGSIASEVWVEWRSRMRSCAGRADSKRKRIFLNPRLREHGAPEVDRTFRHELAHLLAQFRAGRRRILPHGKEWRRACHDLGIGDEKRCHDLPFPIAERIRRFLYKCPNCERDFPRARRIRRVIACLACCRVHNRGRFDSRFRLRLMNCSGGL